jgi:DNA-binding NarL/FixJ family response regulator
MKTEPIRIFLVDNHGAVREALKRIINAQDDMTIVGEAANGHAAIQIYPLIDAEITLIDLNMPGVNGFTAIKTIKEQNPKARFIAMSAFDFEEDIEASYDAGATAFLTKDTTRDVMLKIIRSVYTGTYTRPGAAIEKSDVFSETKDKLEHLQD